jgi:hypothetical protein
MASRVWVPLFGPLARRSANGKGDQGRRDESSERGGSEARGATIGGRLNDGIELSDFVIGETFWTHHGAFRCTNIGTRVVVAVKLGPPLSRGPKACMENFGSPIGSTTTRAG